MSGCGCGGGFHFWLLDLGFCCFGVWLFLAEETSGMKMLVYLARGTRYPQPPSPRARALAHRERERERHTHTHTHTHVCFSRLFLLSPGPLKVLLDYDRSVVRDFSTG